MNGTRPPWPRRAALSLAASACGIGLCTALAAPPAAKSTPSRAKARTRNATPPAPAGFGDNTPLTDEQRIVHALNRLGFGTRPGDVEKVKALGYSAYLDLQLHPERIDDRAVETKLARLQAVRLPGTELAAMEMEARRANARFQRVQRQMQESGKTAAADAMQDAANAAQSGQPQDPARQARNAATVFQSMTPEQRQEMMQARQARAAVMDATREMIADKVVRAVESERQLYEVLVDFWSNHFNIDLTKTRVIKVADEREVIRQHALGKFRDLLGASAKSPAMLIYLDNFQSVAPQSDLRFRGGNRAPLAPPGLEMLRRRAAAGAAPAQEMLARIEERAKDEGISAEEAYQRFTQRARQAPARGINENYARELLELHTLGVDGGYTQKDVQEVARCLTGWGISGPGRYGGQFEFHARQHDEGEKTVLGATIPAGGGIGDGEKVLDLLARHPATMRHLSTKLCRRLVSDDPPASLVDKCVATWKRTDGDLREVVRTIALAPEFFSRAAYRQKIKSPFEYAVSSARALGATCELEPDAYGGRRVFRPGGPAPDTRTLAGQVATMGQPLYQYAFPTGYPEDSRKWVSAGALISRLNFALGLVEGRIGDLQLTLPAVAGGSPEEIVNALAETLLHGELSPSTRATLLKQARLTPQSAAYAATDTTRRLAALVLGAPEFQRR